MSNQNKRWVAIWQIRDIWIVRCLSLPIKSEFGRTREEALKKMEGAMFAYLSDSPGAPPDVIDPQIVSIDVP